MALVSVATRAECGTTEGRGDDRMVRWTVPREGAMVRVGIARARVAIPRRYGTRGQGTMVAWCDRPARGNARVGMTLASVAIPRKYGIR